MTAKYHRLFSILSQTVTGSKLGLTPTTNYRSHAQVGETVRRSQMRSSATSSIPFKNILKRGGDRKLTDGFSQFTTSNHSTPSTARKLSRDRIEAKPDRSFQKDPLIHITDERLWETAAPAVNKDLLSPHPVFLPSVDPHWKYREAPSDYYCTGPPRRSSVRRLRPGYSDGAGDPHRPRGYYRVSPEEGGHRSG